MKVHVGVKILEVVLKDGRAVGIKVLEKGAEEPSLIDVDLVVVSCGVRPRDELAKGCGLELGARGGIKVDAGLRSSDPAIYAVGEAAGFGGGGACGKRSLEGTFLPACILTARAAARQIGRASCRERV